METKSPQPQARLSVSAQRSELFLKQWTNLPWDIDEGRLKRFLEEFADLLPMHGAKIGPERRSVPLSSLLHADIPSIEKPEYVFWAAKDEVMGAWAQPTEVERQKRLLVLVKDYGAATGTTGMDGFLEALLQAIRKAPFLAYCRNPECQHRFFISRRVGQPYCSRPCARPAQRETKRRWWKKVGKARRVAAREKGKRGVSKARVAGR
jgi:hypothetical protein